MANLMPRRSLVLSALVSGLLAVTTGGWCAAGITQKKNQTKGQAQLKGAFVKFGEVYSLKGGWNVQLIKAAYSMDYFPCYTDIITRSDQKLVVIDFAIKNATPTEKFFNTDDSLFLLVDDQGNKYRWAGIQLANNGLKGFGPNVQPGQGYGQVALKNPLRCVFRVPLDAKITKIMTNAGRLNKQEDTLRYMMAGTDPAADPANKIAPLAPGLADPKDPTGIIAAPVGNAKIGTPVPAGHFMVSVKSVTMTTDAIAPGKFSADGKKWVIVVLTAKSLSAKDESAFEVFYEYPTLKDTDGNNPHPLQFWAGNAPTNAQVEHFENGEERTFRMIWQIGVNSSPVRFQMHNNSTYSWQWDLSSVK